MLRASSRAPRGSNPGTWIVLCAVCAALAALPATAAARAPNDDFANAITLPSVLPTSTTGTNDGADTETGEPGRGRRRLSLVAVDGAVYRHRDGQPV